MEYLYKST